MGYFANAQYDEDPLSSALPTLHPKEEARFVFAVFAREAKQTPGRVNFRVIASRRRGNPTEELTGHILLTLVVGYFACAQYDDRG